MKLENSKVTTENNAETILLRRFLEGILDKIAVTIILKALCRIDLALAMKAVSIVREEGFMNHRNEYEASRYTITLS